MQPNAVVSGVEAFVNVAPVELEGPDLIRAVADAIEADPESYEQDTFGEKTKCGTAFCICGQASWLLGRARFYLNSKNVWRFGTEAGELHFPNGEVYTIGNLMGISRDDADCLFDMFWIPREPMTVPEALRSLADGTSVQDITDVGHYASFFGDCED